MSILDRDARPQVIASLWDLIVSVFNTFIASSPHPSIMKHDEDAKAVPSEGNKCKPIASTFLTIHFL